MKASIENLDKKLTAKLDSLSTSLKSLNKEELNSIKKDIALLKDSVSKIEKEFKDTQKITKMQFLGMIKG